jgi:CP family cyanate transporter-like MFS transporter
MNSVPPSAGRRNLLLIAGILLIATTLRVTFTGAAPLLDAIRSEYGLTTAQTGLLTTLPLLAFGLVSPLAAGVARRFGIERSLLLAMILICLGVGLRSLPFVSLLFIGTAIIGCGIALGNVLLPGLIKRDFSQHVAKMTGAYSLTMGRGGAGFGNGRSAGARRTGLARRAVDADGISAAGAVYLATAGAQASHRAADGVGRHPQPRDLALGAGLAGDAVSRD